MPNPATYQFNLPQRGRPSDVMLNEVWYPGIQAYWEHSTSSRIFDAILGIKAVVIHATAGSSSAGAISVMRDGKASFHWLLPDEDEPQHGQLVWACAPEARAAWHVRNACSHPGINDGADKVNHWSLGSRWSTVRQAAITFPIGRSRPPRRSCATAGPNTPTSSTSCPTRSWTRRGVAIRARPFPGRASRNSYSRRMPTMGFRPSRWMRNRPPP